MNSEQQQRFTEILELLTVKLAEAEEPATHEKCIYPGIDMIVEDASTNPQFIFSFHSLVDIRVRLFQKKAYLYAHGNKIGEVDGPAANTLTILADGAQRRRVDKVVSRILKALA